MFNNTEFLLLKIYLQELSDVLYHTKTFGIRNSSCESISELFLARVFTEHKSIETCVGSGKSDGERAVKI